MVTSGVKVKPLVFATTVINKKMNYTDTITKKEAEYLGIINAQGLGFVKPQTAFKNITERLLAEIKKENLIWRQGWRSGVVIKGKTYGAQNYETQRPYTGGNAFFINMQNLLNGTDYKFFLTAKQIIERGGKIKAGAKPFPVSVFIKNLVTKNITVKGESKEITTEERGVVWYEVFPIDLVDGLKEIIRKTHKPDTFNEVIVADADTLIENMPKAPPIKHGGDKAFYTPSLDYVQLPHKKAFKPQQNYYSVAFHELIHSTGHSKRLDRGNDTRKRDGGKEDKKAYAFEELIAEIGAAYLCGVCEIDYYTLNNSAAYLKSWAGRLTDEIKTDPNFLKRAVFKAARAANFIIGTTLEKHGVVVKDGETKEVVAKPLKEDKQKSSKKSKYDWIKYTGSFYDSDIMIRQNSHRMPDEADYEKAFKISKLIIDSGKESDVKVANAWAEQVVFAHFFDPDFSDLKKLLEANKSEGIKSANEWTEFGYKLPASVLKLLKNNNIIPKKSNNILFSKYPKGLQKFIDIAYNNPVADALFKITKIKGVKQDVTNFFSENYNPDGKLSKTDAFVKFYNDVQDLKAKNNTKKPGEISPDKNIKASVNKAIEDLMNINPDMKRRGAMFLAMFYSDFKNSEEIENILSPMKAALYLKNEDLFEEIEYSYENSRYKGDGIKKAYLNIDGHEIMQKIEARLKTLKAKKSGTDLFPELAGITDALLYFLTSFLGLDNTIVSRETLLHLINTLHASVKLEPIKKNHPLRDLVNSTQEKITDLINCLRPGEKIKLQISNKAAIESKISSLQGLGFWNVIASAVIGKGAELLANKHIFKSSKPQALSGINGFVRADKSVEVKTPDTFRLKGELGKFLLDIQPYKYSIVLTGDPHAGKTEVVMQLANGFSEIGKTVGAFMLEQGGLESKDTKAAIHRNINAKNQQNVYITGEAPKGVNSVKEFANKFNVIIVDSWQKLGIPSTKFDDLRHEFPNTIFIVIFQQNGEGGTRGGVSADYDTPVHLKVHKVDSTFENNYVEMKKNRGNAASLSLKYMVKSKKTISEQ